MQKITDELIARFLNGLCTKEESAAVTEYFENNPEDSRLFDEFQDADGETSLPMGYSEDMLAAIRTGMAEQELAGPGAQEALIGTPLLTESRSEIEGLSEIGTLSDIGTPSEIGTLSDIGTAPEIGTLSDIGTASDIGTPSEIGTAPEIGTLSDIGTPSEIGTPAEIGTPSDIGSASEIGTASEMRAEAAGEIFRGGGRVRSFRRWATAAAAAMILGLCSVYLLKSGRREGKRKGPDAQYAVAVWVDQFNHSKKHIEMVLPDGTRIRLMPNSGIRYRKAFTGYEKREVVLTGVARFEVAKSEHLPFVVSSEGLNTCVLGTIFEVTALPSSGSIKVKLIEGKVMLSLEKLVAGNERKEYYLQPGQEFVFDKKSRNVAINAISRHRNEIEADEPHGVVARPDSLANWYMFNNQSLAEVFDQLSMIYNVHIQYSRKEISKLYFIGKLEKKDSLQKIIQDIALLNHLTVTDQNGHYIITKTKP